MSSTEPIVFLNGQYIPRSKASIDIEDRGVLFADGVYEVLRYYKGCPFAIDQHIDRLRESLKAIRLTEPAAVDDFAAISSQLVKENGLSDAKVYWQITRGSATRDHIFPRHAKPTVLALAYSAQAIDCNSPPKKSTVILVEDIRWHLCSIKSLMLLPNVLAKNQAHDAGVDEAIMYRGDVVTEGSSTSIMAVIDGQIRTHPADKWILGGITRSLVLRLARELGIGVQETAIGKDEIFQADEVILCGTTVPIASVTAIDGKTIGRGGVGPIAEKLHEAVHAHIAKECGL